MHMHILILYRKCEKSGRVLSLNSDEINMIFKNYFIYLQRDDHEYNTDYEFKKRIVYFIFNSTKII